MRIGGIRRKAHTREPMNCLKTFLKTVALLREKFAEHSKKHTLGVKKSTSKSYMRNNALENNPNVHLVRVLSENAELRNGHTRVVIASRPVQTRIATAHRFPCAKHCKLASLRAI